MSGFIYIWYDKKHKRFYVGSHWGSADDGYICSSTWMRNAYKRRPADFKRRIIAKVESSRNDLLIEEHRWLQMIEKEELGKKFYNLTNHLNGHWYASDEERRLSIREKMSLAKKGKPSPKKGIPSKPHTEATKLKMSKSHRSNPYRHSDEAKQRISISKKSRVGNSKGTVWITDGSNNHRISKHQPLPNGFRYGRT